MAAAKANLVLVFYVVLRRTAALPEMRDVVEIVERRLDVDVFNSVGHLERDHALCAAFHIEQHVRQRVGA